jgi:glycosyltransferase involved in cell wall biosynthesis
MHDERESVEPLVRKALAVLSGVTADFELLIVDDGSRDGSGALADQLAAGEPRLRVVRHERNLGYGRSLRTGFAEARGEVVAYTDCDEPADLALLPQALEQLAEPGVDMVVGYRVGRGESWRRRLYTWGYNALLRSLFGLRLRDINFAFKLARRPALAGLRLTAETGFVDGQLMIEAARLGRRVVELPVRYRPRLHGRSHFDSPGAALATLREILRYWWTRR